MPPEFFHSAYISIILGKDTLPRAGYLLGETDEVNVFRDPDMLKRLNNIAALPEEDKKHILYTIDNLLASVKTRMAFN